MNKDLIIRSDDFQGSKFPDLAVLYSEEWQAMFEVAEIKFFSAKGQVVVEGQEGAYLYLVRSGLLRVIKQHAGSTYEVATIGPGEIFGEASILYQSKSSAIVHVVDDCVLYAIPCSKVQEFLKSNEHFLRATQQLVEKRSAANALVVNPIFSTLPMPVREVILYNAKFFSLDAGEVLMLEGEADDKHMFIILDGELEVSIHDPRKKGEHLTLTTLSSGDEAGEITVVTSLPHMATVTAVGAVRVLAIRNSSVLAWADRHVEFAYALYATVYRKLMQTQDSVLTASKVEFLTRYAMPSLEEFKKKHHLSTSP
ncbi:MAG: cyclic nucleotide-binding domain-containing protein [Ghiorsea sp.]|nr:cyclic nucleotide-binding domain-containing protein [Ghiorsea sp.]